MKEKFIAFIESITPISKEEEELLLADLEIKQVKKGVVILKEGDYTQDTFLILEGIIRRHRMVNGVEKTTGFFTEGDAVAEFDSVSANKPSLHSYSTVEDTIIVVTDSEKEKAFYKILPRFEEISRLETEKMLGKNQEELSNFITKSPEERYIHLSKEKPGLLQRVPQHQIASYLGVTPESLSRIRKRIMKLD